MDDTPSTHAASGEPVSQQSLPKRFVAEYRRHMRSWTLYAVGVFTLFLALGDWGLSLDVLLDPGNTGLAFVACALAFFFAATASGLEEGSEDDERVGD